MTKAEIEAECIRLQEENVKLKKEARIHDFILCGDIIKAAITKSDEQFDRDGIVEPEVHFTLEKKNEDGSSDYTVLCFPLSCAIFSD